MFSVKRLPILLLSLQLVVANTYAEAIKQQVRLPSVGLTLLPKATFVKPMAANKKINFVIWLKLRNKRNLDKLVEEIYDPNSPNFQKFLTATAFNHQYAPSEATEQVIQRFFTSKGMQAKIVNHSIRVTATVQQVEQSLHVQMNYYRYQNRMVFANATAPVLDADLASYVSEISGLSNLVRFKPFYRMLSGDSQPRILKPHDINMVWKRFTPAAQPTTTSLNGFTGATLAKAYDRANITVQATPVDGAGQTIIINAGCDINSPQDILNDANTYNATNGLPQFTSSNFKIVKPNGTAYSSCGTSTATGWAPEIALDIESAHTIAPGANIALALTSSTSDVAVSIADIVNTIVSNHFSFAGLTNAYVISNSWGAAENVSVSIESTLQAAAAQGISINFSTGDCGDNSYTSGVCQAEGPSPIVNYPASSAYATAIGGTSMFVDNNWNYAFETVWGTYSDRFYFGGGGGVSKRFGPVSWQSSIESFTAGGYGLLKNLKKRALPDLSMVGDPLTGLYVFQGGGWQVVGGTSLSCPLFSGTVALINQARALQNKTRIGFVAPYLYNSNNILANEKALNVIVPPHQIISGATRPPVGAPLSAFTICSNTFGWDSSLTVEPELQFWNDAVGVGSPKLPNFVMTMANV